MFTGAITSYIDVAQVTLYAFWIFFAGLIYYLHREDKREGYPLESDRSAHITVQGWPTIPKPKTYHLANGHTSTVPNDRLPNQPPLHKGVWRGAPLVPTGGDDLLLAGVGPGSWNDRSDMVDLTAHNEDKIVPLRVAPDYGVAIQDTDPRGLPVIGADGKQGGTVVDMWVDRSEALFRYFELETAPGHRVLVPFNFARVHRNRVVVKAILGRHFARVPGIREPDRITLLEEEKIMAYYGAGKLYATPSRQEPLL